MRLDLEAMVLADRLDVVAVTETWLDGSVYDTEILSSNDFSIYRNDRNRHGGGIMLLVHNSI